MNKLRKIYKGEETWVCLYENKDQILKGTEGNKTSDWSLLKLKFQLENINI